MLLIDVALTPLQRRNRAAFVRRADLAGSPELAPGQRVVLRDERGDFFAGSVIDHDETADGPRYRVRIGVRLPEEYAMLRLGHQPAGEGATQQEREDMQWLLDLIGDARDAVGPRVPRQRLSR